jgi:hypothetical protein
MVYAIRILITGSLVVLFTFFPGILAVSGQELPLGYITYYQQKCTNNQFINSLETTGGSIWKLSQNRSYTILEALPADSSHTAMLPSNRGVIKDMILGEYILEFEFRMFDSPMEGNAGFYFLSPVKDCDTYYAFCFTKDSLLFYITDSGTFTRIDSKPIDTSVPEWNKVRIERDILRRSFNFSFPGTSRAIVSFSDPRLVMGYLGFGTQNVNSGIRNVMLWAPTAIDDQEFNCQ